MVRIQIVSDLHLESPKAYDIFEITPQGPVLALLGDIGVIVKDKEQFEGFIKRQLQQFQVVLLVLGNHEAYGSSWPETLRVIRDFEQAQRGTLGQGEFVLLDRNAWEPAADVNGRTVVLGCSLFSNIPQDRAMAVELGLNDFFQTKAWSVKTHNESHARDVAWLNAQVDMLQNDKSVGRIVILTHWSPTVHALGTDPRHAGSPISSAFATNLEDQICSRNGKVCFWAFGHTHYNCDFSIDRTDAGRLRYYTNQRGYYFSQAKSFEPGRILDL